MNTRTHVGPSRRTAFASAVAVVTALLALAPSGARVLAAAPPNPLPINGTWAIKQVTQLSDINGDCQLFGSSLTSTGALLTPGLRGFGTRIPWKDIDHASTLLDAGKSLADGNFPTSNCGHLLSLVPMSYSPRMVAGTGTPASYFSTPGAPSYTAPPVTPPDPACPNNACVVPTPFMPDGSPNTIFEGMYDSEVSFLANWCKTNGVHLLHLPWYGLDYAELNNGAEVQAAPGYSYHNWLVAHERLVDIAFKYADSSLAIEFPLSGYGPLVGPVAPADNDLANYIAAKSGGNTGWVFVQANGLGPQSFGISDWGTTDSSQEALKDAASWTPAIGHGEQMIDEGEYDWNAIYNDLLANNARYVEVYAFTIANPAANLANHTLLLSKILSFATATANGFSFSGQPGTPMTAGTPFTLTVTATSAGVTNTAYTGTVHLTATDPQAGLPADYTFVAADHGVHNFGSVTLKTAGSQVVMATDAANALTSGYSPTITVNSAAVNHLTLTPPAQVVYTTPFSFTLEARDQFQNDVPSYAQTVHFTDSQTNGGTLIPANYTYLGADAGSHSFSGVLLNFAGTNTLTATETTTPFRTVSVVIDVASHGPVEQGGPGAFPPGRGPVNFPNCTTCGNPLPVPSRSPVQSSPSVINAAPAPTPAALPVAQPSRPDTSAPLFVTAVAAPAHATRPTRPTGWLAVVAAVLGRLLRFLL